jgi:hypothetical protein
MLRVLHFRQRSPHRLERFKALAIAIERVQLTDFA